MNATELKIPFLRSCKTEELKPVYGRVTGDVPSWLEGHLLRIGPGLLNIGQDRFKHVFDGLALMQKFSIQKGLITYQNRFLQSDAYIKNIAANRIARDEAPKSRKTIFPKIGNVFKLDEFSDNNLANIVKYANEYYACSDSNYIWKIDPETLQSLTRVDLRKHLPMVIGTVHPHEDKNGSVYNIGNSTEKKSSYVIIEIPPKDYAERNTFHEVRVIGKIPMCKSTEPSFCHSFGMTENYFIFVEHPMSISVPKLAHGRESSKYSFGSCLNWNARSKTHFHIMRRDDGTLLETKYTADGCVVFHHINAYEELNHIIMDLCHYKNNDIVKALYVDSLQKHAADTHTSSTIEYEAAPKRFIIPLRTSGRFAMQKEEENLIRLPKSFATAFLCKDGSVHCYPEALCDAGWYTELPRINYYHFNSRKYRYFYAVARKETFIENCVAKVDVEERSVSYWREKNVMASEPVFVPSSETDEKEDEGILLVSLLFKDDDKKVALLILNARNMQEMARATFVVKSSVPGDFHGIFIETTK